MELGFIVDGTTKNRFMNNVDFLEELSRRIDRSKEDADVLVEGFATLLKERCGDLDSIAIPGFGKFSGGKKLERIERDKESGKRTIYPPEIRLQFEPSAILKTRIAEKGAANGK